MDTTILEKLMSEARVTNEPSDVCPKCLGAGMAPVEGNRYGPCDCRKERETQKRLDDSRLPLRYMSKDFDNYIASTPSATRALMASRRFVEDFPGECGLLYLGSCGVGKTHLACSILKALIKRGFTGLFYDFRDLLTEIQNTWNPDTKSSELQVLRPIFEADVLVLDELGARKPTEWVQETMTQIVNTRYLNERVTIFTTNYLDIGAAVSDETLTDRLGVRLRSRLKEMCREIGIEAPDYREVISRRQGAGIKKGGI
jgi:DNA replication protein DnaC